METKKCPRCGRVLDVSNFSKNSKRPDGLQNYCKDCQYEMNRANRVKKKNAKEVEKFLNPKTEPIKTFGDVDTVKTQDGRTLVRQKALSDYTPKELLIELKSRGYVWDKMYKKCFVDYNTL